jgi:four helix bundle protein
MNPKAEALKARTKRFALDVLEFIETLPTKGAAVRIGYQLADAATSVAANYRAACRARSDPEFAAKIGLVLEESDESLFWLEICEERTLGEPDSRRILLQEAYELTAIFTASTITSRERLSKPTRLKNPPLELPRNNLKSPNPKSI